MTGLVEKDSRGLDEVVAIDASVHVERMSNDHMWMAIESAGERVVLNFYLKGRSIHVSTLREPK
jgi:hypothetical protein